MKNILFYKNGELLYVPEKGGKYSLMLGTDGVFVQVIGGKYYED